MDDLRRLALAAIVIALVLFGSAAYYLHLRGSASPGPGSYTISVGNADFRIVRPFSEPPEGLVITSFADPQNGADARFYVTLENLRNDTMTGVAARVINGTLTFCSIDVCTGSTGISICPEQGSGCSLGSGQSVILTAEGKGAVAGDGYAIELTATYANGYASTLYTLVRAEPST
ncbi:MAG: hypothetical protein KGI38_03755 [Thaumarchaeota archaeon]|nr:hypothetical protein [Nitrososphaerota archaeon]